MQPQSTTTSCEATTECRIEGRARHISGGCCKNATMTHHQLWTGCTDAWMASGLSPASSLSRGAVSCINGEAPERRKAFRFLAFRVQFPGGLKPGGEVLSNLGLCLGDGFGRWLTMHRRRGRLASAQCALVSLGLVQLYFQLRYSFAAGRGARRKNRSNRNEGQSDHHVTCEGRTNRPAHIVSRFGSIQLGL